MCFLFKLFRQFVTWFLVQMHMKDKKLNREKMNRKKINERSIYIYEENNM